MKPGLCLPDDEWPQRNAGNTKADSSFYVFCRVLSWPFSPAVPAPSVVPDRAKSCQKIKNPPLNAAKPISGVVNGQFVAQKIQVNRTILKHFYFMPNQESPPPSPKALARQGRLNATTNFRSARFSKIFRTLSLYFENISGFIFFETTGRWGSVTLSQSGFDPVNP